MKIIITTPNNFSKEAKAQLVRQGVCLIEAKDPGSVKIISDADFGDSNQLLLSALDALDNASGSYHTEFYKSLSKRLKQKQQ